MNFPLHVGDSSFTVTCGNKRHALEKCSYCITNTQLRVTEPILCMVPKLVSCKELQITFIHAVYQLVNKQLWRPPSNLGGRSHPSIYLPLTFLRGAVPFEERCPSRPMTHKTLKFFFCQVVICFRFPLEFFNLSITSSD